MGFLERAIRRGVSQGVGNAVGKAIQQAVEPKATELANKAAEQIDQAAQSTTQQTQQPAPAQSTFNQAEVAQVSATLGGLFGGISSYANEAAKNMKICPSCGEGAGRDVKFCPKCGGQLPEATLGDGAVCPSCGKQNAVGTKFCQDCGTKLPAAIQEEQAAQAKSGAALAEWDRLLPQYPKWRFGGKDSNMEEFDGSILFAVKMESGFAAQNAVKQFRELLTQNGFRQAGEYPAAEHLYKMENGICYHCDTEHCFESEQDCPTIYFNTEEPTGGFDYVKPEPKKQAGFKNLFKF